MSRRNARSWPETFEVNVHTNGGTSIPYRLAGQTAWLAREKLAATLAAETAAAVG
jgi:hypothetical protein